MALKQIKKRSEGLNDELINCFSKPSSNLKKRTTKKPKKIRNKKGRSIIKLSIAQWKCLFKNDPDRFKREIFFQIEKWCKRRGLIKVFENKRNGFRYETYMEGTEGFIDKQLDDISHSFQRELAGEKEPFFISEIGFEVAIKGACYLRMNNLFKKCYFQGIQQIYLKDEYIAFLNRDFDPFSCDGNKDWDVARIGNGNEFYEPVSGYNRTAESIVLEKEQKFNFDKALNEIGNKPKNGPLYRKAIEFYIDGHAEDLKKREEITALSEFLGVSRKEAIKIKYWALKLLEIEIAKTFPLDEYRAIMKQKSDLAISFKEISIEKLLEIYDKRNSRFLDPYIDEKEPGPVRHLKVIDGGGSKDKDSPGFETAIRNPKATNDNIAA